MFRSLTVAAAATLFALPAFACDGFEAHDAYVRASTAMSQSAAAFMVLRNTSGTPCQIVGVRSDAAARTELHTHREDAQGVMRMIEIEGGIALPAQSEHLMQRGGDHVMFLGLTQPLAQGATVEVIFVFEDGAESSVTVPVDNERAPAMQGHSHGHSHGHGTRAP